MVDIPSFGEFVLDEEEQAILDRLSRLVGEGPATFFRDACRLARQSPGMPSASNLVAHLCREIESTIEALLVDPTALPGGTEERCGSCGAAVTDDKCAVCGSSIRSTHRVKKRSVLARWGISEVEDVLASAWVAQKSLDTYAHRRGSSPPRPLDEDFLALWQERKSSLRWLLGNFENEFLTKLKPIVASAMAQGPGAGVRGLKTLPFTLVAHRYMFSSLDSADWIEPLVKAGFYEWPPRTSVDSDGNEYYPPWPQSSFLVRFATDNPDSVCDAVLTIPDTENPWVIQDIFAIVEVLPLEAALRLVPRLCDCLRHYVAMPWQEALPVMRRLRDAGNHVEAMSLALAALRRSLEHSGMTPDERAEAIDLLSTEHAPDELKGEAEELLATLRRQQRMAENSWSFAVAPQSPLSKDEINAMTYRELADYVVSWRPSDASFDSPTERGLAESVCRLVDSKPEEIAEHANLFSGAPAEFSGWLLSSFTGALRRDVTLQWGALLSYLEAIVSGAGEGDSHWAKQEAAGLLEEALRRRSSGLDRSSWPRIWGLIARLASESHPTPDDEAKYMNGDAFTYSLNCVRGRAVHALFAYLSLVCGESGDEPFRLAEHTPDVARELERLLSPANERSLAVRAAIGAFWPWLHGVDAVWVASHTGLIFPEDDESSELWRSTWVAAICWNQPSVEFLQAYRAQYARAASELAEVDPNLFTVDYHRRFAEHLGLLLLWCAIDPRRSDEILVNFYARTPVAPRKSLVDFLGLCLTRVSSLPVGSEGGVTDEALEKLVFLMGQRLSCDAAAVELSEELEGFGEWFASGLFDGSWSLGGMTTVAAIGGKVGRPDLVRKQLAELYPAHPQAVLELCEALLDGRSATVIFRGRRPEIAALLDAAEAHNDDTIASAGRRLRSRLVAHGYIGYAVEE